MDTTEVGNLVDALIDNVELGREKIRELESSGLLNNMQAREFNARLDLLRAEVSYGTIDEGRILRLHRELLELAFEMWLSHQPSKGQ